MKIHILHNLREEPWGGGNQFLKALRGEWIRQGAYTDTSEEADAILINSYPFSAEYLFDQLWHLKRRHPNKIVMYRLDGPISFIRQKDQDFDRIIRAWSDAIADGIVFQSRWCEEQNRLAFGITSKYQTIIHNAPDPNIFHDSTTQRLNDFPIKLIAASWSNNPRKGFDVYQFLDEHLDFNKYTMTFVGNAPVTFKHIKMLAPLPSNELADVLRYHDIFITASKTDPCSNSLIEALACGLPSVALKDGGHPELVQNGGELFADTQDVLEKIDNVADHITDYQQQLPTMNLTQAANNYLAFVKQIWDDKQAGHYSPKRTRVGDLLTIKRMIITWKAKRLWNKSTGSSN